MPHPLTYGTTGRQTRFATQHGGAMTRAEVEAEIETAELYAREVYAHPADLQRRNDATARAAYWRAILAERGAR